MVFGMFNGEEYFLNGATVRVVFGFMFGYWREDERRYILKYFVM